MATTFSGSKRAAGGRTTSLARHIAVRVAFPVGILFLSCFSLIDQLMQRQLREHITQELETLDHQNYRGIQSSDARLSRALPTLASAIGTAKAMERAVPAPSPAVEALLANQLSQLGVSVDEDILALAGPDRRPIVTLRRQDKVLVAAGEGAKVTEGRTLTQLDGSYYFLTSHPLHSDGKPVGWVVTGRHWLRDMPLHEGWYLVTNKKRAVEVAGGRETSGFAPGAALPPCIAERAICEVDLNGKEHLVMRSAASPKDTDLEILLARPVDLMAIPVLGLTRGIMFGGALLCLFGVIGLTLLTERSVSQPLKDITDSCARAHDSGHSFDIRVPQSRIREVNDLGQTLQTAVQSIGDGQTRLTQAYFQFMGAIVALLDARDTYTAGHSHRVSAYSEALARNFGLPPQQIEDIRVAALLHDIGKIGVPDEILRKHERLTKEEFDLMKQHPTIGRNVLEQIAQFDKYLDAVELHHENLDGTGYPRGLRGEQIPISARIVKVADVYDALSTDRPYRKRMPPEKVHAILRESSGTHFDRLLVEVFLSRCVPSFGQASGLERLQQAVGDTPNPPAMQKTVGA